MTTVTRDGVTYEVEDGWRDMSEYIPPRGNKTRACNILFRHGGLGENLEHDNSKRMDVIAWRPIVPPKVKRWRAEKGEQYVIIDEYGDAVYTTENESAADNLLYSIGNYFRTREEAEASNKAKVMRDPESERCQ
jgi:hypothetical protein